MSWLILFWTSSSVNKVLNTFPWDITSSCVISNHFWWFEIIEHNFVLCMLCSFLTFMQVLWFFFALSLDSCFFCMWVAFWFGCDVLFNIFLYYVICVMITIVVGVNIKAHIKNLHSPLFGCDLMVGFRPRNWQVVGSNVASNFMTCMMF